MKDRRSSTGKKSEFFLVDNYLVIVYLKGFFVFFHSNRIVAKNNRRSEIKQIDKKKKCVGWRLFFFIYFTRFWQDREVGGGRKQKEGVFCVVGSNVVERNYSLLFLFFILKKRGVSQCVIICLFVCTYFFRLQMGTVFEAIKNVKQSDRREKNIFFFFSWNYRNIKDWKERGRKNDEWGFVFFFLFLRYSNGLTRKQKRFLKMLLSWGFFFVIKKERKRIEV